MEKLIETNVIKDDVDSAKNYFKSNDIDNMFINKIASLTGLSNMTVNRFKTYHVSKSSEVKISKALFLINNNPDKAKEIIEKNVVMFRNINNNNFKERMEIDINELSDKVKNYMLTNNLTLKDLSKMTNVSVPTISRILAKAPKRKIVKSVIISILKVVDSNIPYSSDIILENKIESKTNNKIKSDSNLPEINEKDIKIISLILKQDVYKKLKNISDKYKLTPTQFIELFINSIE